MLPLPRGAVWQMFFLLCAVLLANEVRSEGRVVCYYTNWSVYRPGAAKYNPQNINPYLCTHLVYAFGGFTKDNTMKPFDKYQDIEQGGYAKFTGLKTYNKQLKTMIAIGGWNEASTRFSPLVASSERRQQFIKNILKFLRQNHFDGIDLDWEYPAHREGGKPRDKDNYAQFVQELRTEFDRESAKTGRPRLLLTMAVPAGIQYIEKGYDIPKLNQYLDWFNLLTYDFHSSHEPSANHHAPLYSLEEDDEYNFDTELNIDYSIKYYLNAGADRDKLVLGIPTYGRSYTLINEDSTDIGAPSEGPGEQGDATREKGYLAYYEICQNIKDDPDWTVVQPNPSAMGPYAFKGNLWVGYDDEAIVRKKAEYVVENGLGGIMFWAIDNDDFRGTCTGKPYPLIEAAKEAYLDRLGVGDNEVAKPSSKKKPLRSRTRIGSSNRNKVEQVVEKAVAVSQKRTTTTKRPQSQRRTTKATTTTTTGSSLYIGGRTTTPEPPTTPDPGSDFKCEDEGFFQHPRDCKKYFWCLDSGPSDLGIVAHMFTCPSGLYFNPAADSCDFARNVPCNKNPKDPPSTTSRPTTTTTTTTTARTTTASSRITAATSRNSFIRFTSTTTQSPEDDEEYEDEEDEPAVPESEEDPKVIKELIDLIKKVGGIEELEKHLLQQEDGTVMFKKDDISSVGLTTTPPSISKSLYDKVLSRPNLSAFRNKFTSSTLFRSTSKPKPVEESEEEEEIEVKSNSGSKYSSVVRNSRPGPQNAGIDKLPEFEGFLKEKKKYVTIQRTKPLLVSSDEVSIEEDQVKNTLKNSDVEDDDSEDANVKISSRRPSFSSTPAYTSIRRTKSTTVKPEVVDENVDDDDDLIVEKKTYTPLSRNRVRSTPADIETTTVAGSRYKFLERTRPTRRPVETVTAKEDVEEESNGNDDDLSVTVQYTDQNEISTQTPTQQPAQATTIRAYASLGRRTTTTTSSSTTTTAIPTTTDQVLTTTTTPASLVIDTTTTPEPIIITTTTTTVTNPMPIETSTQSLTINPIPAISSTSTLNPSTTSQDDELVTIFPKTPNTLATESGLDTQEIDSTQNQILTETTTIDDTNRNEVTNLSTKTATTRIKSQSQSSLNINSSSTSSSNSIRGTLNNKFPGGGRRQKTTTASSIDTNQQDQESSTTTNEFLGTVSSPRPFGFPRRRTRPTTTTTTGTTIVTGGLDDVASSTANPSEASTQLEKKVSSAQESYLRSSSRLSQNVDGTQNVYGGTSLVVDHVANVDDSLVKGDGVSQANTDGWQAKRTYSWKDARNPILRYQKTYPKENLEKIANYYDWQIGSGGRRDDERFAQNGGWSTIWGQAYSPSLTYHDGSRYGGGYGGGLNGYKDFSGKYDSGSYVPGNRGKWRAKSLDSDGRTFRRGYGLGGQDIVSTFQSEDSSVGGEYVYRGPRIYGDQSGSVDDTAGSIFQANDNRGDGKYRADGVYRGWNGQSGRVDETAGGIFQVNYNRGDEKYGTDGVYHGWNGHSQGQVGKSVQGDEKFKFEGQYVGAGGESESHGFDDGSYRWRSTATHKVRINDVRGGQQIQDVTKTHNGAQASEQEDHVRGQAKHVGSGVLNESSNNLNVGSRTKLVQSTEFGLEASNSNVQGAEEASGVQGELGRAEQGLEVTIGTIRAENSAAEQSEVNGSAEHKTSVENTSVEESSSEGVKDTVNGQTLEIQNQEGLSKSTLSGSLSSTGLQGTFEDTGLTKHNFSSLEVKTVSGSAAETANRTATTSRLHGEDEETYVRRRNRNRLGSTINEEVIAEVGSGQSRQQKISVSREVEEKTSVQQGSIIAGGYAGSHVVDESVYKNKNLSIPRGFSKFSTEEGLSSGSSSGDATSFAIIENSKQEDDSNSLVTTSLESGVHSTQDDTKIVESDNSDKHSAHNSSQTKDIVAEEGASVTEATNVGKASTPSLGQNYSTSDILSEKHLNIKNSTLNQSIETYSSGFEKSKDTSASSRENVGNSATTNSSESTLSSKPQQVISEGTNTEAIPTKNSVSTVDSLPKEKSAEVSSVKESVGETKGVTRQRTLVKSYIRNTNGSTSGTASRGRKIVTSFGTANALNKTTIRNPTRTRPATKTTQDENLTVSVNRRKGFRASTVFSENQNLTSEAIESGDIVSDANEDISSSSQTSATTSAPSSVVTYRSRQSDQRRTYTNPTVASPKQRILTRTQLRAQSTNADLNKETLVQASGRGGSSDETENTQATYYEPTSTTTRRLRLINRGSFRPVFNDLSSLLALDVHAKHHRTTSTTAAPGQDVRRRRPVERTTTEASILAEIQRSPRPTRPPRTTTTTEAPVPTVRPTSLHRAGTDSYTRSNSQSQQDNFVRRRKIIRNRIKTDSSTSAGVSSNASATQLTLEDQTLRGDQLTLKANLLSLLNDGNPTNATNGSMLSESEVKVNFESGSQIGVDEENMQDSVPNQSLSTAQVTRSRYTFQTRSRPTEVPTTTEIVEVVKPTIPRGKSRLNLPDLSSLLSPDFESKRRVNASVYRLQKTMKNLSASTTGAAQIVGSQFSARGITANVDSKTNVDGSSLKSYTEADTKAQLEETAKESKSSNIENKTARTTLHGGFKRITTTLGSGIDVTKHKEGGDLTGATIDDGGSHVVGVTGIDVTMHKEGGNLTAAEAETSTLIPLETDIEADSDTSSPLELFETQIVDGGSHVVGGATKSLSETTTTSQLVDSSIDVTKHNEGSDLTAATIIDGSSLVTGETHTSLSATETVGQTNSSDIDPTSNLANIDLHSTAVIESSSQLNEGGIKTTPTSESEHQLSSPHIKTLDEATHEKESATSTVTESPTTEDIQSATEELIATLETGFPLPAPAQIEQESIESANGYRLSSEKSSLTSEVVHSNQIRQQDDKYKTPTVPIFSRRNYYKYIQDSPIIYIGKIGGPGEANAEHVQEPKNAPSNNEINRTIFEVFDVYNDSSKTVAGKDKDVGEVTVRPQDNPPKTEEDKNSIAYEINSQLQHFLVPAPRPINDLGADEDFTTTEVTLNEINDEMMKLAQDVNSMSVGSDLALLEGSGESSVEGSDLEKDSSVNLAPSLTAKQGKSLFANSIATVNALEINSMMDHSVHSDFRTKKPFGFRSYTSEEQEDSLFTTPLEDSTTMYTPVADEHENSLNSIIDYEVTSKQVLAEIKTTVETTDAPYLDGLVSEVTTISPSSGYAAEAETSTLISLETDIEADSDTSSPLELFETQSSTETELESHRTAKTLKDRDTFKNHQEDINETGYELVGTSETGSFSDRRTLNARQRPQTNTAASLQVSGTGLYRRKGPAITSTVTAEESTTLKTDDEGVEIDDTTVSPSLDAKTPRRFYKSRINLKTSSKDREQHEGTENKTDSAVPSNQIESSIGGKFSKKIPTSENIGIDFTRAKGFTTRITTNRNRFKAVSQNKFELLNGAGSKAESVTEAIGDVQNDIGSTVLPSILSVGSGFEDRSLLTARRQFGVYSRFRTTNPPSDLVTETSEIPDEESVTETANISRRPTTNALLFNRIRTTTEASLDLENDYATNSVNLDQSGVSVARRRFNRLRTTPASPFESSDVTELADEDVTTGNEILEQSTAGTTRRTFNGFNRFRTTTGFPNPSKDATQSDDEEVTTDVGTFEQSTVGTTRRTFAGFNRLRSTTSSSILVTEASEVPEEENKTEIEVLDQSTPSTTRRKIIGLRRLRTTTTSPIPLTDATESADEEATTDVESLEQSNRLRSTNSSSILVTEASEVPEEENRTEIEILDQSTPSTRRRKIIGLRRLRTTTTSSIPSTDATEFAEEEVTTDVESLEQSTAGTTSRTFTGFHRLGSTTLSPISSTDPTESVDEEITTDVESLQESKAETTRRTFNGFNRLRTTTASAIPLSEDTEVPEEEIDNSDLTLPSTTRRTFNGFNRLRTTTASAIPLSEDTEVPEKEIDNSDLTLPSTTRRTFNGFNRLRTTTASPIPLSEDTEVPEEEIDNSDLTIPSTTRRTFNGFNRLRTTTASPIPLSEDTEVPEEEIDNSDLTLPSTTRRTFNGFNRLRTTTASAIPLSEDTEVPEEEIDNSDLTLPSTTRRTFNGFNRLRTTTASPIPLSEDTEISEEEIDNSDLTLPSTTRRTFNGFNRLRTTTASPILLSEDTEVPEEEIDNSDLTLPSTTRRTFNEFNRLRTTTASRIPLSEDTEVPEEEIDNSDLTLPSTTRRTFNGFNRLRTTTASKIPLSEDTEVPEEESDNSDLTLPSTTRRTFNGFNRLRTPIASPIPLSEDTEVPEEEIDNSDLTLPSTTRRTFNGFNRLRTTTASAIPLSEDTEVPEEEIDNSDLTLPSTTRRTFNGFNRLRTTTASKIPLSEDTEVPEEEIDNSDLTLPSTTRRTFNGFNRLRTTTASRIPLSEDTEVPEEEIDNSDLTLPSTTRRTFNGFNRLRTTTASAIPLSEDTEVPEEEIDNSDLTLPSTTRRTFIGFNRLRTTTASAIPLSEDTEISEEEIDNSDLTLPSTTRRTFNGFNRLRTTTASAIPLSEDTEVPEEEIDNSDLTLPSTTRRTFNGFNRLRTTTASSIQLSEDTEVPEEEIDNSDLTLSSTTLRTFNGFNRLRTTTASSIPLSEDTGVPEEEIDNSDLTLPSTTRRTFNGFNRLRTTTASAIPLSEDAQILDEEIDINNLRNSAGTQSASNENLKTNQRTTSSASNDIVSEFEQLGLDIVSIDRTLLNGADKSHANIAAIDIKATETPATDPPENQENEITSEQSEGGSNIRSTINFTNAQQARPNLNVFSTSSVKSQANRLEEELLEDDEDNDSKSDGSEEVTSRNIVALLNRNRFNPIASTRLEATEQSASPESNRAAGIISTRLQRVFANDKSFNRTSILNNLTNRTITNLTVDTIDERTHTNLLSLTEANNLNTEQTELGPNDDSEPEDSIIENNSNLSTNTPNFDRRFQRVQFNRTAGRRRPNTTTPITTTTRTTTLTQVNPSIDDVNVIDSTSTTNLGLTSEPESESDSENGTSEDIETGTSTEAAPKPRRRFRILKFKRPLIVNNSLSVEINNSTNTATVTSTTQTSGSRTGSVENSNLGLNLGVNNNPQVGGKRFRKVIRRLRPVANRTVTSTEATAILDETTKPLNIAEFISQFSEDTATTASVADANEITTDDENLTTTLMPDTDTSFETTISDNEVTSELPLTESTTSRPAPPTPRRLLVNRRPYRPTKPSINAITSTDSSSSIATQRTYVRKFNRNFKAIRPPSDSTNGIGFIEQTSGRPQTDFVGRNRFNFPTRTTTQSTRFENQEEEDADEEDYDDATNVNQDEDERVESPVLRPNVQFKFNQVQSQTIGGDNQEEDTEVNDVDDESTEETEEEDVEKDEEEDEDEEELPNKVSSLPPQVVYRPTRPSNRPSFNRPANTPFVPNRPSAAVPANRFPGRAQNKTRVVNRPTLITLPPNLLDSDKPTVTASITPPSVFISTNTRSYERKYTATSTEAVPQDQSNPLLEDLNIDALNARNKKIFESNSKKHTTIKPKLIQNQPQPDTTDTPTNSFDTSTVFEEEDNEDNNLINSQEASEQTTTAEGITEQPTAAAEGELILYSPKQKLVTINRVVEVNSKEDKLRRKSKDEVLETVESTHLRPEGIPKLEALGEISRSSYVHLVDGSKILVDGRSHVTDYTPTESSVFVRNTIPEVALDSLENTRIEYAPGSTSAPFRNSVPDMDYSSSVSDSASDDRKSKAITVPQVIVDVIESSTISLEGLFDAARQAKKINDASNEVNGIFYAYSLGEVPTTPKNEKPKLMSTTESTTPLTTTTTTTSTTTTTTTTTQTPETTTTTTASLPTPSTTASTAPSQPTITTESADDMTTESTTAPVPAPLVSRPLIPLLRPESNEFPLVRTVGIQGRRPSIRRRLYATAQPVASTSNDELNTDGISTISADDDAAVTSTTPATTSLFKYNRRTRPSYGTTTVAKLKPTAKVLPSSSLTSSPGEISTIISTTGSAVASSNDVTFVTVNKLPNQKFPSGVIRRKFIRPLNASRSTTTPPPSVTTVEVGSGAASEEVAATTLPRTQNPLFKRRFPPTTTVAPLTTIRSTEFNTSPLYLDTLIPDDIDQVAKSSVQDSKIFHNQIGDTYGDSKHTPDISISTKIFRSTTPNYSPKDDEPITRRLDIIATTRRPLLRRPQKTTPIPEKAPIFISRRRPHKTPAPFSKIIQSPTPGKTYKPVLDYDYYDDDEERVVDKPTASQVKVVLHGKGIIECLDQGNFPHPLSCRKFISCAKFENGGVVGWEYTCPKGLSYDPVGGICNWAAGLGCKE